MSERRRGARGAFPLVLVAAAATAVLAFASSGGSGSLTERVAASQWRGLVGAARPPVDVGQRVLVVLNAPSLAQRVAAEGGLASDRQERAWTTQAYAAQRQLLSELATHGLQLTVEYSYARVLNGFSAAADPRTIADLERSREVAGVYPVRVAYPASLSSTLLRDGRAAAGSAEPAAVSLPGFDGRGVTIALLDTGVDRVHPYVRGRVQPGFDVIGPGKTAVAAVDPMQPSEIERHGTEMAGILAGADGPAGYGGVAAGASILPIRVAGWQLDAHGRPAVYSRTDQLLAGLERAVDPNGDGDAHDAARIALIPLAEPYAAFADSPESRAVAGATALDTLVVTAAGNDGPAGPGYGNVSGPGGAPSALTVGSVDERTAATSARLVLRAGLETVLDARVPLAGAVSPGRAVAGPVAVPVPARGGASLGSLFDRHGFSEVAGKIAVVPAGGDPAAAAEAAARAGATAVVLYGATVPAGSIGLRESVTVPVVSAPAAAARTLLAAAAASRNATASIGAPRTAAVPAAGRVAPFSSRGLAFDGRVKPDLVAPGVDLLTADPGANEDRTPRFAAVTGSSASAAVAAGAAAVLAQARPRLGAADLRRALLASARPLGAGAATAGNGRLDLGAAASAELVVSPPTLALGRAARAGGAIRRTLTIESLSPRWISAFVGSELEGQGARWLRLEIDPQRVTVKPFGRSTVRLTVRVVRIPRDGTPALGTIDVTASGGETVRAPLSLTFGQRTGLLGAARLSARVFKPSDARPAVLAMQVGRVRQSATRPQLLPVSRLDLGLFTAAGKPLGLLARLRDLLPGRYVFGLTGRGPRGATLHPGTYRIKASAWPTDGGPASVARVAFRIR